jgi:hypothetical protein
MSDDEFEVDDDCEWINKMKKNDKLYNDFYQVETRRIKVYCLYVNNNNELVYINKDSIELNNKVLNKTRLISLLKTKSFYNKRNYKIKSLLKYNIDIFPEDIPYFIKEPNEYDFLNSNNNINDMKWRDSIDLFQDMNSLYIIYYENSKNHSHKNTRKVHINKKKKKTRKNIY